MRANVNFPERASLRHMPHKAGGGASRGIGFLTGGSWLSPTAAARRFDDDPVPGIQLHRAFAAEGQFDAVFDDPVDAHAARRAAP